MDLYNGLFWILAICLFIVIVCLGIGRMERPKKRRKPMIRRGCPKCKAVWRSANAGMPWKCPICETLLDPSLNQPADEKRGSGASSGPAGSEKVKGGLQLHHTAIGRR
jgi:hypothetical protein